VTGAIAWPATARVTSRSQESPGRHVPAFFAHETRYDAELVAWPARHGDECMAVFFLFRNRSEPFRDELAGVIDALRPVFAAQMAKLVRIHHRSRFQWPQAQTDLAGDGDADGESGDDGREDDGEGWRKAA
jgi:hypothetical protein